MTAYTVLISCPSGLEEMLQKEIQLLTNAPTVIGRGWVKINESSWNTIYQLNLHLRTASRVLLQLAHRTFRNEQDLYRLAYEIEWEHFFSPDKTIKIHSDGKRATVKSLDFMSLKVKDALCDRFRSQCGYRPSVDKSHPDVRIEVFLDDKTATIYLDTSGEALFKRGYRHQAGEAPLRENLAAGLLLAAGFDGSQTFLDPMCGSGTLAIEAYLIAARQAPGLMRSFGFEHFKNFNIISWQKIKESAQNQIIKPQFKIFAADKNQMILSIAQENAHRAQAQIQFEKNMFEEQTAPDSHGILLSNPPYGERLGELEAIQSNYPAWGSTLKKQFAGWKVGLISADKSLPSIMRLSPKRKMPVYNGALDCRLYLFDMVEGSMRK